jgi:hypothetical protein
MTDQTQQHVQAPAKSVLSECREIAHARLCDVIGKALAKIDEDLFQLADKTLKRAEQQVYLDAMTRVRQHRADILKKFEECFRTIYDQRLDGTKNESQATQKRGDDTFGGIELSLVSDSIIETGIAIDRLAKTVRSAADNNEVLGIRARLGMLLNRESLEDADNPLSPEAIFEALKLACNHIPAEDAVKQALLSAFQPYLSSSITQIYHAVNESLVAHHILPRIRHTVKTTGDPMGVSQRMMGLSATQRMNALSQSGRMAQFDPGSTGAYGNWSGSAGASGPMSIAAMLAGLSQGNSVARVEGLRMLADPVRFGSSENDVAANAGLLETLARIQTEVNLGATAGVLAPGYLRSLDRTLFADGTPLDQLTIELVTVVFDYLNGDARIADAVKGLIARLQIVAVKAALLDRSFFARRQHPMRRLLDRMAEAGSDPAINLVEDGVFLSGVKHIVDDLAVQFKDNNDSFETALSELDVLVSREHEAAEARASAHVAALAAQEARSAADAAARADIAARLKERTPGFIRDFLSNIWVGAIVDAQLNNSAGEDSVAVRLNLAADLIWSVEPKGRADIPALAGMLPKLVRGLIRGVSSQGIAEEARQVFFNQLMKAHTEAIAAAKASTVEVPSQPVPSQAVEPPVLKAVPLIAVSDAFERTAVELAKGAMVDFSDQQGKDRYKLTWVSPKKTFYLFTNGVSLRQMSAAMLAGLFRQGLAELCDGTVPIIDRALDAMGTPAPAVELAA